MVESLSLAVFRGRVDVAIYHSTQCHHLLIRWCWGTGWTRWSQRPFPPSLILWFCDLLRLGLIKSVPPACAPRCVLEDTDSVAAPPKPWAVPVRGVVLGGDMVPSMSVRKPSTCSTPTITPHKLHKSEDIPPIMWFLKIHPNGREEEIFGNSRGFIDSHKMVPCAFFCQHYTRHCHLSNASLDHIDGKETPQKNDPCQSPMGGFFRCASLHTAAALCGNTLGRDTKVAMWSQTPCSWQDKTFCTISDMFLPQNKLLMLWNIDWRDASLMGRAADLLFTVSSGPSPLALSCYFTFQLPPAQIGFLLQFSGNCRRVTPTGQRKLRPNLYPSLQLSKWHSHSPSCGKRMAQAPTWASTKRE